MNVRKPDRSHEEEARMTQLAQLYKYMLCKQWRVEKIQSVGAMRRIRLKLTHDNIRIDTIWLAPPIK